MSLGAKIKNTRLRANLTRKALAEAVEITQDGLYKIETDQRKPSFLLVCAIAKALDVPVTLFVD